MEHRRLRSAAWKRLGVLLSRDDFRRNPLRACYRRVTWRLRWALTESPWPLSLHDGRLIVTPRCGAGALIYYQGQSEPETADFLRSTLRPGMTFVDGGAHIGEYTVLASRSVTDAGVVHAFEPNPMIYPFLARNAAVNKIQNAHLYQLAVDERGGCRSFVLPSEPSLAAFARQRSDGDEPIITVRTVTLDAHFRGYGLAIDIIKIDVEGPELLVLRGATGILASEHRAPLIVFEWSPANYTRFGYSSADILAFLRERGYRIFHLAPHLSPVCGTAVSASNRESLNLVAIKRTLSY
jgi:FkbM family methyltransferase